MDERDEGCESERLIIDLDDEPIEVKEEIDETQLKRIKKTNENKANANKDVGRHPKITNARHGVTADEQNIKINYIKIIDDARDDNFTNSLRYRIRGDTKNNSNNSNNKMSNRFPNSMGLNNVLGKNQVNMDVNMSEIDTRIRAEQTEENLATKRAVYDHDVYEHGYAMEGFMPHALINNTFIPCRTEICNRDVMPNIGHSFQAGRAFRPEVNDRTDVLTVDDYRNAIMNRNIYRHVHRPDLLGGEHVINRNAYILANKLGVNLNINDCRQPIMHRNLYHYPYSRDALSLDDYRYTMHRHALNDHYRSQVPIHLDPYMSRVELQNIYRPDVVSLDPYRLDPAFNGNIYHPETAVDMYAYPHVAHSNPYRNDLRMAAYRQEAALNLNLRQEELLNSTANRSETDMSMNANKVRTLLSSTNRAKVDKNKPGPNIPSMSVYKHKTVPSHKMSTDVIENNIFLLNSNKKPEAELINVCKPEVPVRNNRPSTVILSTEAINRVETSNKEDPNHSKETNSVNTNSSTDSHQNAYSIVIESNNYNKTILIKNAQEGVLKCKSHEKRTTAAAAGENINTNVSTRREINEVSQESIRFLVVFFTRVKELVGEIFPELAKSLQKEIQNLGKRTDVNKTKTDIQYICPLNCSVSTYSFPRFDSTDDDNKVEKHINSAQICDVCRCIQRCYRLYKNKYFNLFSSCKSEENANKIEENGAQRITCKRKYADCDENISRSLDDNKIKNKPQTNPYHAVIDDESDPQVPPEIHKVIHKVADSNTISGNIPVTKQNMEYTLFNELSTLTFNLPNSTKEATTVLPYLRRLNHDNEGAHANICSNNNVYSNRNASEKPAVTIPLNINDETANNRNRMYDKISKNDPNLVLSLSNEINNVDLISSKLKNKLGRKPDAVFTCHVCSCLFTNFASFASHMQQEHNMNGTEKDIPDDCIARKCPFCGFYSKQKYHNDHVKRSHPEIFAHKGEPVKIKMKNTYERKSKKRKYIFTCLLCHEQLPSSEVNGHRKRKHRLVTVARMFSKRLT